MTTERTTVRQAEDGIAGHGTSGDNGTGGTDAGRPDPRPARTVLPSLARPLRLPRPRIRRPGSAAHGRHRRPRLHTRPRQVLLTAGGLALAAGALSVVQLLPEDSGGGPGVPHADRYPGAHRTTGPAADDPVGAGSAPAGVSPRGTAGDTASTRPVTGTETGTTGTGTGTGTGAVTGTATGSGPAASPSTAGGVSPSALPVAPAASSDDHRSAGRAPAPPNASTPRPRAPAPHTSQAPRPAHTPDSPSAPGRPHPTGTPPAQTSTVRPAQPSAPAPAPSTRAPTPTAPPSAGPRICLPVIGLCVVLG